jgi:diaminohydroxyphosphoribosylaminopyrimidine deaminase/5-amino-6-(5-phosphoribosylamino)uracil reductase
VIAAGIARVVSALEDPDPRVCGRGHRRLREAGVEVTAGVFAEEAARDHRGHILRSLAGRPCLTLKLAETADGFAAGGFHDPRLRITGRAADARVHILRAQHDAILIGAGTAAADDPLLTVRLPGMESARPLRVVLDAQARLSPRSRLAATARDWPALLVAGPGAPADRLAALANAGVQVETCAVDSAGRIEPDAALRQLAARGHARILCEGGPTLAARLLADDLVDDMVLIRAPKPFGQPGVPALSAGDRAALQRRDRWRRVDGGLLGPDHWDRVERIR